MIQWLEIEFPLQSFPGSGIYACCVKWPKKSVGGSSLVVEWLRLSDHNAGGLGSLPHAATKSRT